MRCLLLGATGFLGGHVLDAAGRRSRRCTVVTWPGPPR